MEHCSSLTQSCPEVLTFLQTKHAKASPEYLSSVEFRNTLGRCLTRTQANRSKAFVYINELCTALRQHAVKRRQTLTKVQAGPSTSSSTLQFTSDLPKRKDGTKEEEAANPAAEDRQPSTSGLQEGDNREDQEAQKRAKRASRKQVSVGKHYMMINVCNYLFKTNSAVENNNQKCDFYALFKFLQCL